MAGDTRIFGGVLRVVKSRFTFVSCINRKLLLFVINHHLARESLLRSAQYISGNIFQAGRGKQRDNQKKQQGDSRFHSLFSSTGYGSAKLPDEDSAKNSLQK